MTFDEKYNALEDEFCAQVKADRDEHGVDSEYISNTRPDGPVDFVLIAMEPSIGRRPNYLDSCTPPLGFAWSTQILYYITASETTFARVGRPTTLRTCPREL